MISTAFIFAELLIEFQYLSHSLMVLAKVLVAVLVTGACVCQLAYRIRFTGEVILYGVLLAWSLTGILVGDSLDSFTNRFTTLLGTFLLLYSVFVTVYLTANLFIPVIPGLIGGLILYVPGAADYFHRGEMTSGIQTRISGTLHNPNAYAHELLMAACIAFFFWPRGTRGKSLAIRSVIIGINLLMVIGIVWSASRKALIEYTLFLFFLLLFVFRAKQRRVRIVRMAVMLIVFFYGSYRVQSYVMENTYIGVRFKAIEKEERVDDIRENIYVIGFRMIGASPIFGVGLGNFETHSGGWNAHSDWLEITSTMGVVGLLIYILFYFVVWKRSNRVIRVVSDQRRVFEICVFKAILVSSFAQGFVAPSFYAPDFMAMVVGLSTYVYVVGQRGNVRLRPEVGGTAGRSMGESGDYQERKRCATAVTRFGGHGY